MKHTDKIATKYKASKLGDDFFDALKNADEEDLKVMLAAIFLEEKYGEAETTVICQGLEIDETTLNASLKYWRGAGLLAAKKTSKKTGQNSDNSKKEEKNKLESAHRDGKIQSSGELPEYSTEELTALMQKRKITSDFIGEAARVYGKIFNQHEVSIIIRMIDYIGFDEESVLMLLSHFSKKGNKKTLRYIEKAALELYDDGITDISSLEAALSALENAKAIEGQIRAMFGMSGRALTTKEKKYIASWTEKMGFDVEMIRLAYDITVDIKHEAIPAYTNGILERWYANGIDTPEKVREAEEKKVEGKAGDVSRSFDNDDFFEAALRRTYGDGN